MNEEKKIILVLKAAVSANDIKKMSDAGHVVVKVNTMSDVQFVSPDKEYIIIHCSECGDRIYLEKERHNALRKNQNRFYCPQGHNQYFPKTTPPKQNQP